MKVTVNPTALENDATIPCEGLQYGSKQKSVSLLV